MKYHIIFGGIETLSSVFRMHTRSQPTHGLITVTLQLLCKQVTHATNTTFLNKLLVICTMILNGTKLLCTPLVAMSIM